jgi:hypothetical protein
MLPVFAPFFSPGTLSHPAWAGNLMKTPEAYTHQQVHELEQVVRAGQVAACPECAVPLDERAVPPRQDVSYVRDRVWLVCPSCHRSAVVDRR